MMERLNKVLASSGVGSRRQCDAMIEAGVVFVDGKRVADLGRRVDPRTQLIEVDGQKITIESKAYFLLNKPLGVICTNADQERRTRAIDLIQEPGVGRLYTVGRLDADSEGIVLLTNDGELTNKLTHPRYGVPKTYVVKVAGRIKPEALEKAQRGVYLAEGKTGAMKIKVERRASKFTLMLVTIREGKNRELRRVFARLGFAVIDLKRIRIGPLSIGHLARGRYRRLTREEVKGLMDSAAPKNET